MSRELFDLELFDHARKQLLRPAPVFSSDQLRFLQKWPVVSGIKPEGAREFDISQRPYLTDLYTEDRENPRTRVVIMKAAQTGLTIRYVYKGTWWVADQRRLVNTTILFPIKSFAQEFMASRFKPMMKGSSNMLKLIEDADSVNLTRVGISNLRARGMKSGIGLDSDPLDVMLFDEVRFMSAAALRRAFVRVSESSLIDADGRRGVLELNSTAGMPGMDIHDFFLRGTQNWWRTPCANNACKHSREEHWLALPLHWPDIVGRDGNRFYYQCPKCLTEIPDRILMRAGRYVPDVPDPRAHYDNWAGWESYQFSQILRGTQTLAGMFEEFNSAQNIPEFFNSRLGLPYTDPDAVPVTAEVLEKCRDQTGSYRWPRMDEARDADAIFAAGIDQKVTQKHIVIFKLGPGGTFDLVDIKVIEASGIDSVRQTARYLKEWRVNIVVCDGEPEYSFVVDLAKRFEPGVVWLQDYVFDNPQAIQWQDERSKESIRRSSGEVKFVFRAVMDRYKAMNWALLKFVNQTVRLPFDFENKFDGRTRGGVEQRHSISAEYAEHMQNIARASRQKEITLDGGFKVAVPGEYVRFFRHLKVDPDFAHATLYAMAGLSRLSGTTMLMIDTTPPPQPTTLEAVSIQAGNPIPPQAKRNTCGACHYFVRPQEAVSYGFCNLEPELRVETGADTPMCDYYREPDLEGPIEDT